MRIGLIASLSLRNVWRYGRKSAGTLVIMTVAVMTLSVLYGYVQANLDLLRDAYMRWGARGHLIIERPLSELALVAEGAGQKPIGAGEQRTIEAVLGDEPALAAYARVLRISGIVTADQVTAIFAGIGQDVAAVRRIKGPAYEYDVVAGQPLWMAQEPTAMVLGQGLATILGCEVPAVGFAPLRAGETPTSRNFACPKGPTQLSVITEPGGHINAGTYRPVGIMDWGIREINDRLVVLSLDTAQRLLNTGNISAYHVLLDEHADVAAAQARLTTNLRAAGSDAVVFKWSDRATFFQQVRGMLMMFFAFVLIVALVIGFMSLLNSSYMNFTQRTRELATLRSFGFAKSFVLALTGFENMWLAAVAAVLGVIGALGVTHLVGSAGLTWTPPGSSNAVPVDIAWVPAAYLCLAAALMLVAIVASAIPTRKILARPIRLALSDV